MWDLVPGDIISGCVAFTGIYEWYLTRKIVELVHGGAERFVDVGANMGYFSILWASLAERARVVSFEPVARNIGLLTGNREKNHLTHRIEVIPKAASDTSGLLTFAEGPADQTGWGGIATDGSLSRNDAVGARVSDPRGQRQSVPRVILGAISGTNQMVEASFNSRECRGPRGSDIRTPLPTASLRLSIPCVRLDEAVGNERIDLLKVDVEGAEAMVLRGAERLLRQGVIRRIVFEHNSERVADHPGDNARAIVESHGYQCQRLGPGAGMWLAERG